MTKTTESMTLIFHHDGEEAVAIWCQWEGDQIEKLLDQIGQTIVTETDNVHCYVAKFVSEFVKVIPGNYNIALYASNQHSPITTYGTIYYNLADATMTQENEIDEDHKVAGRIN